MHRFYVPESLNVANIELTGDEANHLTRVLRLSPGDCVELFDGRGNSVEAEVAATGKRSATLAVTGDLRSAVRQPPAITLLVAAPKSDRLRWLVEKATELGVHRLTLLKTQHSVVHPGDGKIDKLRAAVIAACKQSGRNDLMALDPPQPWSQVVESTAERGTRLLIAVPGAALIRSSIERLETVDSVVIAIGPEGGWSADEVKYATQQGVIPVGLGDSILRIETAAIAAVSAVRFGL